MIILIIAALKCNCVLGRSDVQLQTFFTCDPFTQGQVYLCAMSWPVVMSMIYK